MGLFSRLFKQPSPSDIERIDAWLTAHAPRIKEFSLNPPAGQAEFDRLETLIGQGLPEDFKTLYRWHNGLNSETNIGSLVYGLDFYPLDKVERELAFYRKQPVLPSKANSSAIETDHKTWPLWLPIADDGGGRVVLCLDLSPGPSGKLGQVIFLDSEEDMAILVAASTADLLKEFADDLEAGRYQLDSDALEEGEHFLSPETSIDLDNWWQSERFKA